MSFEKLLDEKKIEKVEREPFEEISALKDITSVKNSFESEDYDWAMAIAYNSVLRAGRNFMQSIGYRSIGKEHHKNVFEFLRYAGFDEGLIDYFDGIRKTRNSFLYQSIEENSKENAEEVILKAEDFVHKMRTFVLENRTDENGRNFKGVTKTKDIKRGKT